MENKINFDNYSKNYNDLLQEQHKSFGDIEYYSKYKVTILKTLFDSKEQLNILEYGCGIGRNLKYLQESYLNSNIYGFDISQDSIKIAKHKNHSVTFMDEKDFDKYSNFFDIIFIAGVFHHIETNSRDIVTKKISYLLKKDAISIIFEHNPFNPLTRHMVNTCEFDRDAKLLKRRELLGLFIKNNFKNEKSNYTLFFPPKLKFLNFLEKYLGWIPVGGQYYILVKKK